MRRRVSWRPRHDRTACLGTAGGAAAQAHARPRVGRRDHRTYGDGGKGCGGAFPGGLVMTVRRAGERLAALLRKRTLDRELDGEIIAHMEMAERDAAARFLEASS